MKIGAVVVNISAFDSQRDVVFKFKDSGARCLISLNHSSVSPLIEAILSNCEIDVFIIGDLRTFASDDTWLFKTLPLQNLARLTAPKIVNFDAMIAPSSDLRVLNDGPLPMPEDLALLQYTGGTTGQPKGAMLTHGNLTSSAQMYRALNGGLRPVFNDGQEVFLVVLPLSHIYGLSAIMLRGLLIGAELVLHPRFEPAAVLADIQTRRVTFMAGVPTMFMALVDHPELGNFDLSSLKYCNSGGAPLPLMLRHRFQEATGKALLEGWGMTETAPAGTSTPLTVPPRDRSCGLPLPGVLIEILEVDGDRVLIQGEVGEVCVSGPNVMQGYWRQPQATADAFLERRFRTGDIGYLDCDGFLFLIDRKKEIIITNGLKVYPRVIEEAIYNHPSVAAVAVVGIEDDYRGEIAKAFVELRPGAPTISLDELTQFLRGRVARHEVPRQLEIMERLPRTPAGKLAKTHLKPSLPGRPSDFQLDR